MRRAPLTAVRQLADETGMSCEITEFAADMAAAVFRSDEANDSLQSAVVAGCLYAATRAVDTGGTARTPRPNRDWNPQVGHNRADTGSTEMTICKAASITPASLRKHAREAAAIYLDADTEMADAHARQRLTRLTLR